MTTDCIVAISSCGNTLLLIVYIYISYVVQLPSYLPGTRYYLQYYSGKKYLLQIRYEIYTAQYMPGIQLSMNPKKYVLVRTLVYTYLRII